jgi:type IV pilus assembly protein PilW
MISITSSLRMRWMSRFAIRGFSLVELMVAMVIGLVLIGGAAQVYINSRATYAVNETAARLQETARYALSILEPDIRMAGYWGLAKDHLLINGRQPQPTAANPAPTQIDTICGYNYIVDLTTPVQGNNNAFALGVNPVNNCNFLTPIVSADTLTVRHASLQVNPAGNRYRLCSTRGGLANTLSQNPLACAAPNLYSDLVVNGYYVSTQSNPASGGANTPSLRRMTLQGGAAGVAMVDQEVIEGIEDMQIQFGIDPGIPPVVPTPGAPLPHCGIARFYVNPGAIPAGIQDPQIVSVRIWLLVRADSPEQGFVDNNVYQYADRSTANGTANNLFNAGTAGQAYAPGGNPLLRNFRRLLVTRTFQIRNAEAIDSLALDDPRDPCP